MKAMDWRKHVTLLIGLLIPVVMIIFVAASILLPSMLAPPPRYSFLYTSSNDYNYRWTFEVRGETLQRIERSIPKETVINNAEPALYLYDITTQKSTLISFAEAQKLKLNQNAESPDGYQVSQGTNEGGFPFAFNTRDHLYLSGHGASRKIQVTIENGYWNFRFLGWVLP